MKKEYLLAILIALGVLLLNNSPLIWDRLTLNPAFTFLGRRAINSQDMYTYLSLIEQGKQGRLVFADLYNPVVQTTSLVRPAYLFIGKFAQITGLSTLASYQLFRLVFTLLFSLLLYQFISLFFADARKRLITFSVVLLSSGLGILTRQWSIDSTDLWIPESLTFLALAEAPHFILSQALIVGGFGALLQAFSANRGKYLVYAGLFFLLLSFEHPYDLVVMLPILGVTYLVFRARLKPELFGLLLLSSLGVLYQIYLVKQGALLSFYTQNVLASPAPVAFFSGFGLLLPLALVGLEKSLAKEAPKFRLLVIWLVITAVFIYFPLPFQRRLIEGIHIPLAILASLGLFALLDKLPRKMFTGCSLFALMLLSITNLYTLYQDYQVLSRETPQDYYYHLLKEETAAMNWLKENTGAQDVILANWFYGNLLPGLTGRAVYLGHKIQTPDFTKKIDRLNQFLLSQDPSLDRDFLEENRITYVFVGKNDAMLHYGFQPEKKNSLTRVYAENGVEIYQVKILH